MTFQNLISTGLLHNLWILSFLLMFSSGHQNNCGHILIISNLLQPIVTSGTYFNRTTTWLTDSCFSLGIQIMVVRSSPVICYSQQLFSKELLHFCSCSALVIQIMVDRSSSVICYGQLWPFKFLSQQSFSIISQFIVF